MNRWAKYGIVVLLAVGFLYLTRNILAPFIIAIITAYILMPLVDRAQRFSRLPRVLVVALFYLIFVGSLTLVGTLLEPELAQQTTGPNGLFKTGTSVADSVLDLASQNARVVDILRRAGVDIVAQDDPRYEEKKAILARRLQAEIDRATQPGQVREVAQTTFNVLLKVVIWFFATFYLLLNGRNHIAYLYRFVPDDRIDQVRTILGRIHAILGGYLRGQFYLIIIMSVAAYIVLQILHVPYALPIAIGTGILEIVPFVGPIIATTIAALVALPTQGTGTMVAVIIAYFVLRQLEDQIVIPQLIGRVVHLDPVVTIFVVLAGEHIGGIIGVLLAVPVAAAVRVVLDELFPPKVPGDAPSALTEIAVAGTGLPNDPEAPNARRWMRRPHTPPPIPDVSED
jgi:predicted PurR-regulated permease PerM